MNPAICRLVSFVTVVLLVVTVVAAQEPPQIRITAERVKSGESFFLNGKGFTPSRAAISHLKRPDETEHNPLRIQANDRGEFVHRIDSTMLEPGMYELWVEDEGLHVVSNHVRFRVDP